jgi:hypothetical protein
MVRNCCDIVVISYEELSHELFLPEQNPLELRGVNSA